MIWLSILLRSLRETARRPTYLVSLVGLPLILMGVFGAALHDTTTPAPAGHSSDADKVAAADDVTKLTSTGTHSTTSHSATSSPPRPTPTPTPTPTPSPTPTPRPWWWGGGR